MALALRGGVGSGATSRHRLLGGGATRRFGAEPGVLNYACLCHRGSAVSKRQHANETGREEGKLEFYVNRCFPDGGE